MDILHTNPTSRTTILKSINKRIITSIDLKTPNNS